MTELQPTFGPAITPDESRRLLDAANGYGGHLKIMARILSMDGAELVEAFRKDVVEGDGDILLDVVDAMEAFRKNLEGQMGMAQAAVARLFVVGESLEDGATA
jgi:hypothetical protein